MAPPDSREQEEVHTVGGFRYKNLKLPLWGQESPIQDKGTELVSNKYKKGYKAAMNWIMFPQNSYIETLTFNVTVLANKAFTM
jgi:hypothetical protein